MKIPSVTKLSQKYNSDTVLLLLRDWNEIQKVVAALGKSRFVTGNTLAKHIPPTTVKNSKRRCRPCVPLFLLGHGKYPTCL